MATGDNPLHYQWYLGGNILEGQTREEFYKRDVHNLDFGLYFCQVKTHSGLAVALSRDVHIEELHKDHNSQIVMEAERIFRTADETRFARGKVALLIGNQAYEHGDIGRLLTPENDVHELKCKLRKLDFIVLSFVNLRFSEMTSALEHFYTMLSIPGMYALFYYAGHGFSHNGITYLTPVDAQKPLECDYNIATDKIKYEMQDNMIRAFMILNCCRVTHEGENVKPPSSCSTYSSDSSCLYEITSCPPAPASNEDKHSPFNTALLNALEENKPMGDVFDSIVEGLRPFQHLTHSGSLPDQYITLHDPVMLDDKSENDMDKILQNWEQIHKLPEPFELDGEMLGELKDVLSLKFSFSSAFSNVLFVTIASQSLRRDGWSVDLSIDEQSLEKQDVVGEWVEEKAEPGAYPVASSNTGDFILRISHIQRLKEYLKLLLIVTMTTENGEEIVQNVPHIFCESILFSRLQ